MAITFQYQDIKFRLKDVTKIKAWIREIITLEKKKTGQINIVFTSDASLLETNIRFLDHDTYTDIITFDYCEGQTISGDIVISTERVADNAAKYGVSFQEELRRVMIHGVLHLCGYKDKTRKEAEEMRGKESWALKKAP